MVASLNKSNYYIYLGVCNSTMLKVEYKHQAYISVPSSCITEGIADRLSELC